MTQQEERSTARYEGAQILSVSKGCQGDSKTQSQTIQVLLVETCAVQRARQLKYIIVGTTETNSLEHRFLTN